MVGVQADENPTWAANKALQFFGNSTAPRVDLSWLDNTETMFGAFKVHPKLTPGINDTS